MPNNPTFTMTVSKRGDEFHADLYAESGVTGVADLRLRGIGHSAMEAVEICLTELQAKAADGDEIALRFE
jgi:hypothetical protein